MADPISITGLTLAILQSIRSISNVIDDIRDAPKQVEDLVSDLETLTPIVRALKGLSEQPEEDQTLSAGSLGPALEQFNFASQAFNESLEKWTRHSGDGELSTRDRFNIGFRTREIGVFKQNLATCKQSLAVSITAVNLSKQYRTGEPGTDFRAQVQALEQQLSEGRVHLGNEVEKVSQQINDLRLALQAGHAGNAQRPDDNIMEQLQFYKAASEHFRKLLSEGLPAAVPVVQEQRIGNIQTDENGRAVVGRVNAGGMGHINQTIGDVTTGKGSSTMAGVVNGVNLDQFYVFPSRGN